MATVSIRVRSVAALTQPKERGAETRRRRMSAQRQLAERHRRQTLITRVGLAVVAIAVIVIAGAVILSRRQAEPPVLGDVQTYSNLSRQHTSDPVSYPQHPPVGGDHDPVWQNC